MGALVIDDSKAMTHTSAPAAPPAGRSAHSQN